MDTKSSSFEKRARVDLLDLKDQSEGEAHVFFRSKIVRARMFYANPKPVKHLKLNQFLKVEPPPDDYIQKLTKQLAGFQNVLASGNLSIDKRIDNEEIGLITQLLHNSSIIEPIERGVSALIAYHGHHAPPPVEELVEEVEEGVLTIFSALRQPFDAPPLLVKDVEQFSQALLPINETRDYMTRIERACGAKDKHAGSIANELIKDFQLATTYPPHERDEIAMADLTRVVNELVEKIIDLRSKVVPTEET